jgi:NAD-dependent dihydropyrimidine dehydrogenase PreA subunit
MKQMVIKTFKSDEVTIEIDYDKCGGGADCVDVCPSEVYELVDGKSTAPNIEDCIQCCSCVDACPVDAIAHSTCK